jgi:hypothetical protein
MDTKSSRFAAWLGTVVVVIHEIPLVLHGIAHSQFGIYLPSVMANLYIVLVLYAAPVVAACLLWANRTRFGAWLLLGSMAGSLAFELYHHFLVMSEDHVSMVPAGTWGDIFRVTAVASAVTEVLAAAAALVILASARRMMTASPTGGAAIK